MRIIDYISFDRVDRDFFNRAKRWLSILHGPQVKEADHKAITRLYDNTPITRPQIEEAMWVWLAIDKEIRNRQGTLVEMAQAVSQAEGVAEGAVPLVLNPQQFAKDMGDNYAVALEEIGMVLRVLTTALAATHNPPDPEANPDIILVRR